MNPMYRFFSKLARMFIMFVRQEYIKFKNSHRPVLKSFEVFDVAMVTNFDVEATLICSLFKAL